MKNIATMFACCLLLSGIALAQMEKSAEHKTVTQVLNPSSQERRRRIRSCSRCHVRRQVLLRTYQR